MPVGTAGTVKAMYPEQVRALGADIILGNTYHLMLRPGAERVAALGGLHAFANWPWPILTDSGGYQVMSLAKLRKIDDDGVTFQSHLDGATHMLTPERSIEIQALLDSDIRMQLDECPALPAPAEELERAMRLSLRWAERSKAGVRRRGGRALFGIVQGGDAPDLRVDSARALAAIGFDGYAIGGLAVGEPQAMMLAMIAVTVPACRPTGPRYLMGVGTPGRHRRIGRPRHRHVRLRAADPRRPPRRRLHALRQDQPAQRPPCRRPASARRRGRLPGARDYSRAYLHHLVKSGETLGGMLLTWNNLAYYQRLTTGIRVSIAAGTFDDFRSVAKEGWERGDLPYDVRRCLIASSEWDQVNREVVNSL